MRELPIKRELSDETRKQGIWLPVNGEIEIFSLHITRNREVIITDKFDYTKIYSIQTLEFFNLLEEANM